MSIIHEITMLFPQNLKEINTLKEGNAQDIKET